MRGLVRDVIYEALTSAPRASPRVVLLLTVANQRRRTRVPAVRFAGSRNLLPL